MAAHISAMSFAIRMTIPYVHKLMGTRLFTFAQTSYVVKRTLAHLKCHAPVTRQVVSC
jgi:hypothetical protein